ncbi:MAG: hypothetical protein WCD76_21340 [Pyrinomonadaceae bacterium]
MTTEERVLRLENAFASLSEIAAKVDLRTDAVVGMLQNHEERFDDHTDWINQLGAAQAETERKIAALVDAQIRTEDALARLADAQAHTDAIVGVLVAKVDALTDLVKGRS